MKIVKIESNNCPQCRLLDIMLDASGIKVDEYKNVDVDPSLVEKYDLMGVPVLLFTEDDGETELDRITGTKGLNPEIILEKIEELGS